MYSVYQVAFNVMPQLVPKFTYCVNCIDGQTILNEAEAKCNKTMRTYNVIDDLIIWVILKNNFHFIRKVKV